MKNGWYSKNCKSSAEDEETVASSKSAGEACWDTSVVKSKINKILSDALSGRDASLRTEDGQFIRWGLVEKRIYEAIDDATQK